jgi:DNA polymerase-1
MATLPHAAIIDGHAQFFRAYYAIRGGLSSPVTGEPTNLVFGFISTLFSYVRAHNPEGLVVVIDAAGDNETFRSALYPAYKAHRDPAPADFHPQVERCLEALKLMGIPVLAVEGVEADDVIATLVARFHRANPTHRLRMVSRDKDLGQLVDAHTTLFDPHKNEDVGLEQLFDSKGVRPEQVVDLLSLMGDSADNVPGVPGVGPKTAASLLAEYGSIEGIYENLDKIKGKKGEALATSKDAVALARRLVRLKDDCEFNFDEAQARFDRARCDLPKLLEFLRILGFNRLRTEAQEIFGDGKRAEPDGESAPRSQPDGKGTQRRPRTAPSAEDAAGTLFGPTRDAAPTLSETPASVRASTHESASFGTLFDDVAEAVAPPVSARPLAHEVVRTKAALEELVARIRGVGRFAFDTETTSLDRVEARLVGLSFAIEEGRAWYVPVRSPEQSTHLDTDASLGILRPLLEDTSVAKTGHNLKYDHEVLANHGVALRGITGDSMLASWLVDPTRPSHGLDATAEHVLGVRPIPIEAVIGAKGHSSAQRRFDEAPLSLAAPYAAEDAEIALALAARLEATLAERGQLAVYRDVEVPLIPILARMEQAGIGVDRSELARQRTTLERRLLELRDSIAASAPWPFNPDSHRQLAQVLFNRPNDEPSGLGLKVIKRTLTGASTDSEVLEKLAEDPSCTSTLPEQILEYRQFAKLVGTYLKALDEAINPSTGRIHCSFHQTGTATGRLSSSDPNLQNIPIRTEVGAAIRKAFVAREGFSFVSADYSQIELRFLAHLSGDPGLCGAFERGEDIHRAVAAEVFDVRPEDVTDAQRGAAKMVNFGIVYGITASGLARRLGHGYTVHRAKEIIESYRARFRGIDAFLEKCVADARRTGHAATILGRWRPIPQIASRNPAERAFGERVAVNTVVQGSAADLIKVAMIQLDATLTARFPNARMLLQIHDELLIEAPSGEAPAVAELLGDVMRGAMTLRVPLAVSSATGARWSDV